MRVTFIICLIWIAMGLFIETMDAQNLRYGVMWKGDSIGYVSAINYDSADYSVYLINSRVKLWFFGAKTIEYDYYTLYHNEELVKASTKYRKNGNLKSASSIHRHEQGYKVVVDGEHSLISDSKPIDSSITTIYHREPNQADTIFSERFGTDLKVSSKEANRYSIEKPDGKKTDYVYENGRCKKVIVDNFFARVTFELCE